ncbi:unnamed protein product [Larinioides sclopetarius]|uniref:Uncharacterized protein n=1 Tax=Larinioides sclopetarius TaxID=280406 RepID=A0AAV2AXC3_9ARAC
MDLRRTALLVWCCGYFLSVAYSDILTDDHIPEKSYKVDSENFSKPKLLAKSYNKTLANEEKYGVNSIQQLSGDRKKKNKATDVNEILAGNPFTSEFTRLKIDENSLRFGSRLKDESGKSSSRHQNTRKQFKKNNSYILNHKIKEESASVQEKQPELVLFMLSGSPSKPSQIPNTITRRNLLNNEINNLEHVLIVNSSAIANRNIENEFSRITKSEKFDSSSLNTLPEIKKNIDTFPEYPVANYSNNTKVINNLTNRSFSRLPVAQRESLFVRNQYPNDGHLQWYQYLPSTSSVPTRQNHVADPVDSKNECHETGNKANKDEFVLSDEPSEQKLSYLTVSGMKEKERDIQGQELRASVSEKQEPPVDHEMIPLSASSLKSSIESTGGNQNLKADNPKELQKKITVTNFKLQQKSSEQHSNNISVKSIALPNSARKRVFTTKKMKSTKSIKNETSDLQNKKAETRWLLKNNTSFPSLKYLMSSPMSTIFDTSNENGQYYHYVMNIGGRNGNKANSVRNLFKILNESGDGKNIKGMKSLREKLKNIYFNKTPKGTKKPTESSRMKTKNYFKNTNRSANAMEILENVLDISAISKNVSNVKFQNHTFENDTIQHITDKFINNSTTLVSMEEQTVTPSTKRMLTEATTMQPTTQRFSNLEDLSEIYLTTKDKLTSTTILEKTETTTRINGVESKEKLSLFKPTIVPNVASFSVLLVKKSQGNNSIDFQVGTNDLSSYITQSPTVSSTDRNGRNTTELKDSLEFTQKTTTSDETSVVTTDFTTVTEISPFISTSTELLNSTSIFSVGLNNFLDSIATTTSSTILEIDEDNKSEESFYLNTTDSSYSESLGLTTDSNITSEAYIQTFPGPTEPSVLEFTLTPNENSNNKIQSLKNISWIYGDGDSVDTTIDVINSNKSTHMNKDTNEIKYESKLTFVKDDKFNAMVANATLYIKSADSLLNLNNQTLPSRETEYRLPLSNTSELELSAIANNHLNNSLSNETLTAGAEPNNENNLGTPSPLESIVTNVTERENPASYSEDKNETIFRPNIPLVPTETNASKTEILPSDSKVNNIPDLTYTQSSESLEIQSMKVPRDVLSNSSEDSLSITAMKAANNISTLSDSAHPYRPQHATESSISNLSLSSSVNDEIIHESSMPVNYLNNYYFKETNYDEESLLSPSIVDEEARFPLLVHDENFHFVPSVVENYQIHSPEESQSQVNFKYVNYHYEPDTPLYLQGKFESAGNTQVKEIPSVIEFDDIADYKEYDQMPDVEYVELVPYADISYDNHEVDESKFLSDTFLFLDDYTSPKLNENVKYNELNHDNENLHFGRNSLSKNFLESTSTIDTPKFGTRLKKKNL